ncbi:MAG TPA: hypothetical protein VJL54_01905 [Nitrososphaera sp.]|nr:hypothetical protein [Nitrososphaera sp.]
MALALYAAIAGAVAGVLILGGAFGGGLFQDSADISIANAARMPLDVVEVFKERQRGGDAAGGSAYFSMDESFVDDENHCETCIALEYKTGPKGKALVAFSNGKPVDLSEADRLTFWARGENGGEVLRVYAAGGKAGAVTASSVSEKIPEVVAVKGVAFATFSDVTLATDWQKFEINLEGHGISKITHGVAIEILDNGNEKQTAYLSSIFYEASS